MRVAVILAWRPKGFPDWDGRTGAGAAEVPPALAYDRAAAPYTAVHIASLLPRHWDVRVVNEMARDVDRDMDVDAVLLSTMDFCAPHARRLSEGFRARGVRVVVGGLYPTLNPGYFHGAADAVVVGEIEPVLAELVSGLEKDALAPIYRGEALASLDDLPVPRWELVEPEFRIAMGYEATRSCPFSCSFCVLAAPSARTPYRRRRVGNVIRDLRAVPSHWRWLQRKTFGFWDNNLGADRAYFRELCEALVPLKRFWACETSLDTITAESARLMGRAGCRFVYVGLESLAPESLRAANKRHNRVDEYRARLALLHENGMVVMSIFLLGLDGDGPEYLQQLPELVEEIGVDIPVYSLPAPIEHTPFERELLDAGRLLAGDRLWGMDGTHLVYEPRRVGPDELESALFSAMLRSYRWPRVLRRVARRFRNGFWTGAASGLYNGFYAGYQSAIARAGRTRLRRRGPWRNGADIVPAA